MTVADWTGVGALALTGLAMVGGFVVWLVKLGGEITTTKLQIGQLRERIATAEQCHSDLLKERQKDKENYEARLQNAEGLASEIKTLTMAVAHQSDRFTAELSHMSRYNGQALEQLSKDVSEIRHEQKNMQQALTTRLKRHQPEVMA